MNATEFCHRAGLNGLETKIIEAICAKDVSWPWPFDWVPTPPSCSSAENDDAMGNEIPSTEFVLNEQISGVDVVHENRGCRIRITPAHLPSQKAAFMQLRNLLGIEEEEMEQLIAAADKKAKKR